MTVNVPLLRKTLEHITEHPDEWRQDLWASRHPSCGTAYCVAGHAVVMSGYDVQWIASRRVGGGEQALMIADDTRLTSIPSKAAELLGLPTFDDDHDAWAIFLGHNTLRDIYREANRLTDGEIPIPDVLPDGS